MCIALHLLQKQTAATDLIQSVKSVLDVCSVLLDNDQHYQSDTTQIYCGYYTVNMILGNGSAGKLETLLPGLVDNWRCARDFQGCSVSQEACDLLFPPEFATNMVNRQGTVYLVSEKCVALSFPSPELTLMWGSDKPQVDQFVLDFIWNVLYLKLKTPKQILEFVSLKQCDTNLLTPDEINVLLHKGKHEIFDEVCMADTKEAVSEMKNMVQHMHGFLNPPVDLDLDDFVVDLDL